MMTYERGPMRANEGLIRNDIASASLEHLDQTENTASAGKTYQPSIGYGTF